MTPQTLTLPTSLLIRDINALHDTLVAAFHDHEAVVLDIPDDAVADLSFIQLVEASRRHARERGAFITLKKPAAPALVDTLQRGGFLENMDEAGRLFWLHGKETQ